MSKGISSTYQIKFAGDRVSIHISDTGTTLDYQCSHKFFELFEKFLNDLRIARVTNQCMITPVDLDQLIHELYALYFRNHSYIVYFFKKV